MSGPRPTLYLDIDGVLASGRLLTRNHKRGEHVTFDPDCERHLEDVLRAVPVRVVLNSTWRHKQAQLPNWLRRQLAFVTQGASPADGVRSDPQHTDGHFVCLDDSATGLIQAFGPERVVRTDHEHGLTRRKARELRRKLLALSEPPPQEPPCPSA
ncbi:HAD domain-containing protein [Deinococcus sp. RM]|uniref:HAD domain-containing protein n=1 Tax=Deinococcus sp. RM TaxID=2316359 RepID=UPI000E677B40|nr:HAD domain-containing protein [Deinococcus sp. RM]RIY15685.1 hypothetical protein D3W47_01270 [Deinococcus sp. RM]